MSATTLLTQPHFFKPLFPGFEDGLIIPAAFFKYFNGINCEKAMLKSRQKGKLWPVKINGRQLGDGWKQFVQDHDLQIGDFLLFRHEGDLVFYVLVFGRTTCEREYPPFTSTEEEQVGIQEQNIPNDSSGDHPPFTSTEEEPIEIEEQDLPKDSSSGRPPLSAIEEEPIEIPKQNLPNNSEDEHIENQEQNLPKCSASGYPPFTSTEVEPIEIQEQNLPKCTVSGGEFGITEKVKRRLEPEDSCFVLEHPKCVIKLSPDSIRKNRLCVPFKFARESGLYPRSCSIIMKDEDANSWGAELLYNSLNRRFLVGAGWGVFHSVHKLKAGDSLMVELIKNWETPVFKIHKIQEHPEFTWEPTYRNDAQEDEPIEIQEQNLPECSISGKNFGRMKKVKTRYETEASSFVLGRPKCVIKLSPASIRKNSLCIPLKFARESGLYRRTCSIILKDEDADCWSAKLLYRSSSNRFHIGAGWGDFHSAHKLEAGDSLMVELIESGETPVFKLHEIEEQPEFTQAGFDLKKHQQNIPEVTEESEIEEQNLLKDSSSEDEPIEIQEQNLPKCSISAEASCYEHPSCVIKISPVSIRKHILSIPLKFARESGLCRRNCSVILQDEDADSWTAKLLYMSLSKRYYIGSGWGAFQIYHKLKAGDSLTVELIKNGETPVFKMHKIQDHREFKREPNEQAGSCSVIKKSYFEAKVTPFTCSASYLNIPLKFSRVHFRNNKYKYVILRDEEGRSWPAKLWRKISNDEVHIADGWKEFCVANKLKPGDSFVFEFIENGKRPVFNMCGFRTFTGKNREDASPHFYVNMQLSSYKRDLQMRIPREFARKHGLADRRHSAVTITNENGKSWLVTATLQKKNGVYMQSGWIQFVKENGIEEEDVIMLELVKGGTEPRMKCYTLKREKESNQKGTWEDCENCEDVKPVI